MYEVFTIRETYAENARTRTLVLDHDLPAEPGQYVMLWQPGIGEKPFSIGGDAPLTLTVVAVGPVSQALQRLQAGDPIWVRGPLGCGFTLQGERLLLVAGGYGVAPLLFLARRARAAQRQVTFCIGARTAADVLFTHAAAAAGAEVLVTTEDGTQGERGLVTAPVERLLREAPPAAVYGCGPTPMLEALERLCEQVRVPYQLSWEAHIRCGMGLCGGCELPGHPGWLVCRDGPVWRSARP